MLNHSLVPVGSTGYDIPYSARFNDDDSAYLSRTPSTAGNQKTWTYSGWVKRGDLAHNTLLSVNNPSQYYDAIVFDTDDTFRVVIQGAGASFGPTELASGRVFRDFSAWYHIVVAMDTTQATESDRCKIWINGVEEALTGIPTQNYVTGLNSTSVHYTGKLTTYAGYHLDGYLAEVNFVDGQALTPDNFGETGDYGEWKPIKYTGTYGTNGFYLDFENSGSLGADTSGNGNNWTPTNLTANDQMLDSPTNNFATFNSVSDDRTGSSTEVFSEGNLEVGKSANGWSNMFGTQGMPSGKYYWESYMAGSGTVDNLFGIVKSNWHPNYNVGLEPAGAYSLSQMSNGTLYSYAGGGTSINEGSTDTFTWGDILQVAYDADTGKLWFGKNNVWLFSGNPSTGSTPKMTVSASDISDMLPAWSQYHSTSAWGVNFGQDSSFAGNKTAQGNSDANGIGDFYYTPPTGYLALCTQNLPEPTVVPSEHFNTVLYTGSTSAQSITGVGFQPDFTWIKGRASSAIQHALFDVNRGTDWLISNSSATEQTDNAFTSFDSDGFTLPVYADTNHTSYGSSYVAWNWKMAGSGVSNTDGTITSTVSANTAAGQSIVSHTGSGANGTIGHGLPKPPEMIIVKNLDTGFDWVVYHKGIASDAETDWISLNLTNAASDQANVWNDTAPASSVFSVGSNWGNNRSGERIINYCFHSVEGYSKVGSYTGNGSTDGTFVYTGGRPAYVMMKRTDAAGWWYTLDAERNTYNVAKNYLSANDSYAEYSNVDFFDFTSNGFKLRTVNGEGNASGGTYIYLCFFEHPFKYTNGR